MLEHKEMLKQQKKNKSSLKGSEKSQNPSNPTSPRKEFRDYLKRKALKHNESDEVIENLSAGDYISGSEDDDEDDDASQMVQEVELVP